MPSLGLTFCLWLLALPAAAAPGLQPEQVLEVEICFNYGCLTRRTVQFPAQQLQEVLATLAPATDAKTERQYLAQAVGRLYAQAAEQTPIGADKGGNYADQAVFGRMDCIDHSTTTTAFLRLLQASGGLRWHQVLEPVRRVRGVIFQHFSAAIEELPGPESVSEAAPAAARYVVDSWFVDNGEPAVILPLEAWKQGEGPDV